MSEDPDAVVARANAERLAAAQDAQAQAAIENQARMAARLQSGDLPPVASSAATTSPRVVQAPPVEATTTEETTR